MWKSRAPGFWRVIAFFSFSHTKYTNTRIRFGLIYNVMLIASAINLDYNKLGGQDLHAKWLIFPQDLSYPRHCQFRNVNFSLGFCTYLLRVVGILRSPASFSARIYKKKYRYYGKYVHGMMGYIT